MSQPILPYHRYTTWVEILGNGGSTLVGQGQFNPGTFVLEGVDLLNHDLSVGSRCIMVASTVGAAGTFTEFFQGITYDLSQAWFPWRGSIAILPSQTLACNVLSGEWFITIWGHVEPQYSLAV